MDILYALLFFLAGLAFSYVNYLVSSFFLFGPRPSKNGMGLPFIRQTINIGVLVLAYFLGEKAGHLGAVLIATALGLTVPGFLFSYRLSKKLMALREEEAMIAGQKTAGRTEERDIAGDADGGRDDGDRDGDGGTAGDGRDGGCDA